jgi:hypothetical protein
MTMHFLGSTPEEKTYVKFVARHLAFAERSQNREFADGHWQII